MPKHMCLLSREIVQNIQDIQQDWHKWHRTYGRCFICLDE